MDPLRRDDDVEIWVDADGAGGGSIIFRSLRRDDLEVVLPPSIIFMSSWCDTLDRRPLPKPVLITLPLWRRVWWLLAGLTVDAYSLSSRVIDRGDDE